MNCEYLKKKLIQIINKQHTFNKKYLILIMIRILITYYIYQLKVNKMYLI